MRPLSQRLNRAYLRCCPQCVVLDLSSSWRSHWPEGFQKRLVGLGLNAEEMADNPIWTSMSSTM